MIESLFAVLELTAFIVGAICINRWMKKQDEVPKPRERVKTPEQKAYDVLSDDKNSKLQAWVSAMNRDLPREQQNEAFEAWQQAIKNREAVPTPYLND